MAKTTSLSPSIGERTPLLPEDKQRRAEHVISRRKNVVYRILVCALFVSLSFGVTQVP
jgi:hypothetical protein